MCKKSEYFTWLKELWSFKNFSEFYLSHNTCGEAEINISIEQNKLNCDYQVSFCEQQYLKYFMMID